MKLTFVLIAILILGLGVSSQEKARLIPEGIRFTPDGVMKEETYGSTTFRWESGLYQGVPYRLYDDASGSFDGVKGLDERTRIGSMDTVWSVKCEKDAIDDSKSCYLMRGGLILTLTANGETRIGVGGRAYPSSEVAIRVDSDPAFIAPEKAGFAGMKANQIIEAIKKGVNVTTRYQEWPSGGNKDAKFSTYGFAEAFEYLRWVIVKIK
ncbi:MAG TPA: hypothetical protein VGO43_08835 [Pyrinomonadaceae bacterium]|nr:hypothetical protein [Pyrinomonadaceae bacterium]